MRRALTLLLALISGTAFACQPLDVAARYDGSPPAWATPEWADKKAAALPDFRSRTNGWLFANPDGGYLLVSGTRDVDDKPDSLLEPGIEFLNEARDIPKEEHLNFKQAAEHVETKAATLARLKEFERTALVINNPKGPCGWASGIGCIKSVSRILPKGYTMVVYSPAGKEIFTGIA